MKKQTMKKTILGLSLAAVLGLGGTFAYLTATTGEKVNSFTSTNNITGETVETEWKETSGSEYTPGQVIKKNPTVKINANSESAYVGLKVEYIADGKHFSQSDFKNYVKIDDLNTDWNLAKTYDNGDEFYVYKNVLETSETDQSAPALFNSVTVSAGLVTETKTSQATYYTYETDANGKKIALKEVTKGEIKKGTTYYKVENNKITGVLGTAIEDGSTATKLPDFEIKITGYAVQSKNLGNDAATSLAKATEELLKLAQ